MTNTLKRLGWGGAIAVVTCVATARGLAQRPVDPFHDRSDTGEILHVLPTPASIHSPHDTQPTEAPVANGTAVYPASYGSGNLTDHGGPEISNAAYRAIYWNSSVANSTATSLGYSTISSQLTAFISYFGTDGNYSGAPTDD
jgi:hypothetical protein